MFLILLALLFILKKIFNECAYLCLILIVRLAIIPFVSINIFISIDKKNYCSSAYTLGSIVLNFFSKSFEQQCDFEKKFKTIDHNINIHVISHINMTSQIFFYPLGMTAFL